MENKEKHEELARLYDEIYERVEKYNIIATKINHTSRIGVAERSYYAQLKDGETYDELIQKDWDAPTGDIETPGAQYGWLPSSICYGG